MQETILPVRKIVQPNTLLHRYLPRWQNNTSASNLGIVRFGFELFPHTLKKEYGLADWVAPTLYNILYYKPGMTKIDRAWAVCTSRDYSKTTWIAKILPLYLMLIGQYGIYIDGKYILPEADYIRLRARNLERAEEKLTNMTVEFSNDMVCSIFGNLNPTFKEIRDKKLKNQAKLMILKNGYVFQASGLNQPARGANLRDKRPKVDIDDDVENKDNTKSESMRRYNAKEILGEQFGGLDINGLTVYIGNYVHQECIMAKLQKPNSGWRRLFFKASSVNEKGVEVSGWEKRYSMTFLKKLGEWYRGQPELGGWKTFRMEFYNELVSDKDYIVQHYIGRLVFKDNMKFLELIEPDGKIKMIRVMVIISGDPAISDKERSSDGVASCVLFGSDKNRYVHDVSLAKFDIVDRYHDISKKPRILAITPEELGNVKRKGLVSEMARFIIMYRADAFVLENAGQQLAWYNDLKEDFLRPLGITIPGLPYHPVDEKKYKLETGLLNQISAGRYYLNKNMRFLRDSEVQIQTFPENKMDVLDTWFNAEQMGRAPGQPEFDSMNEARPMVDNYAYKSGEDVEEWILY